MKLLIGLFFSIFVKGHAAISEAGESVIVLPPVVVEGQKPATEPSKESEASPIPVIAVTAGLGAKEIDAPVNQLGVSMATMENDEELSQTRRNESWLLDPHWQNELWKQQAQLGLAINPTLKARLLSQRAKQKSAIEFGYNQDHRLVQYRESSGNPGRSSKTNLKEYQNRVNQGYVQFTHEWNDFESLLEMDSQNKDVYSGSDYTGVSQIQQQGMNLKWNHKSYQALSFVQWRESIFDSTWGTLGSSRTQGVKVGGTFMIKGLSDGDGIEVGVSQESLHRNLGDESKAEFQRQKLSLMAAQKIETSHVESRVHFKVDGARDFMKGVDDTFVGSQPYIFNEPLAWDVGVEVSSPSEESMGLVARARRFALIPTPSQRFGDGALLQGSTKLEQEIGFRASAGPWWSNSLGRFELTPFFEHTENEPMVVAVSPVAAKTSGIGSVVARGAEFKAVSEVRPFKIQFVYSYQEALNNTSIQWQRGLAVPGRPKHSVQSELHYQKQHWKSGVGYGYQSADVLDLSGLWFKSPHHDLNGFVGYGTKAWELRLTGAKLMANVNDLPTTMYSGKAGVDLLEPTIEQTEIKLLCEFIL